jgi:hypothetical protein
LDTDKVADIKAVISGVLDKIVDTHQQYKQKPEF